MPCLRGTLVLPVGWTKCTLENSGTDTVFKLCREKSCLRAVQLQGALLALLVECMTLDRKVAGSNLTRGGVL